MADKSIGKSDSPFVSEDKPSSGMYEIVKSFVETKYVNMIGGSIKKGPAVKGGQQGEA